MAQVFSAALFLLLPIASLLQFTVATHPTDGVADRLGIGTFYGVHKHFADTSVTLGLEDGKSVKLVCDGDNGVTAQIVRKGKVEEGEQVKGRALVIEEKSLVFIRTDSQSITIPFKKHSSSLLPSRKERVIWSIDNDEAKRITPLLIGQAAAVTPFGIAFTEHLVNSSSFSNVRRDKRGTGGVELIRYDEKLFIYDTERRDLGWREVVSGVITVKGLGDVEQQTVRMDSVSKHGILEAYDITFRCSGAPVQCVFAAMFDKIPCLRKRTGEGLFQGPWETIEKYAKKADTHEDGSVVYRRTLASDPIATPIFASMWKARFSERPDRAGGKLVLLNKTPNRYTFQFASVDGHEAIRVYYEHDEEVGWTYVRWENWSRALVDRIVPKPLLSDLVKIKGFREGFVVEESRIDENEFMLGKYFGGLFTPAGLQVPIDGDDFVGFCGLEGSAVKFIVRSATWGSAEDDWWVIGKTPAAYGTLMKPEFNVMTLYGQKIKTDYRRKTVFSENITEEEDDVTVKLMFTGEDYISCVVIP
eukprot:GHVS01065509.1.p1 GENE.GHVS01065509.1~~GHVS01065509.1.p1  ORF type:complete len:561 (+),score=56.46 GHVS01065509.1:96-1685(+)